MGEKMEDRCIEMIILERKLKHLQDQIISIERNLRDIQRGISWLRTATWLIVVAIGLFLFYYFFFM